MNVNISESPKTTISNYDSGFHAHLRFVFGFFVLGKYFSFGGGGFFSFFGHIFGRFSGSFFKKCAS